MWVYHVGSKALRVDCGVTNYKYKQFRHAEAGCTYVAVRCMIIYSDNAEIHRDQKISICTIMSASLLRPTLVLTGLSPIRPTT